MDMYKPSVSSESFKFMIEELPIFSDSIYFKGVIPNIKNTKISILALIYIDGISLMREHKTQLIKYRIFNKTRFNFKDFINKKIALLLLNIDYVYEFDPLEYFYS